MIFLMSPSKFTEMKGSFHKFHNKIYYWKDCFLILSSLIRKNCRFKRNKQMYSIILCTKYYMSCPLVCVKYTGYSVLMARQCPKGFTHN